MHSKALVVPWITGPDQWLLQVYLCGCRSSLSTCPPKSKEGNAHELWPMRSKQPNTIDVGRAIQQHACNGMKRISQRTLIAYMSPGSEMRVFPFLLAVKLAAKPVSRSWISKTNQPLFILEGGNKLQSGVAKCGFLCTFTCALFADWMFLAT